MFSHVQLNKQGEFLRKIPVGELIEWDAKNYCTPAALEKDGKSEQFGVYPLVSTAQPTFDPITQTIREADIALIDGAWTQQWEVIALDAEAIAANRQAQVPTTLTIRQAKLILLQNNLLDDVDAAVAQADRATQIEWEYATEVHRNWTTLTNMATSLGITDEQLDQLFIEGSKL